MKAETDRDTVISQGTPEIASKSPEAGERHGTDSPSQPQMEPSLPTPWSQTSSLQNCETIDLKLVLCYGSPSKLISIFQKMWNWVIKWGNSQRNRMQLKCHLDATAEKCCQYDLQPLPATKGSCGYRAQQKRTCLCSTIQWPKTKPTPQETSGARQRAKISLAAKQCYLYPHKTSL